MGNITKVMKPLVKAPSKGSSRRDHGDWYNGPNPHPSKASQMSMTLGVITSTLCKKKKWENVGLENDAIFVVQ